MLHTHLLRKTLSALTLGAFLASPAMAGAVQQEQSYSGWSWSAHVGNLNIDSKVAEQQGIDDSAWVLGAAAEHYSTNSSLTFLIGLDLIGYHDENPFPQNTTDGWKESDASGAMVYAEFGSKIPFGKDELNYFIAHVGMSGIFSSERSISYCSNCYSESIDVNGGLYGVLGIGHSFNNFDLGLQFQQYFSGDLDNSLRLNIATSF